MVRFPDIRVSRIFLQGLWTVCCSVVVLDVPLPRTQSSYLDPLPIFQRWSQRFQGSEVQLHWFFKLLELIQLIPSMQTMLCDSSSRSRPSIIWAYSCDVCNTSRIYCYSFKSKCDKKDKSHEEAHNINAIHICQQKLQTQDRKCLKLGNLFLALLPLQT